MTEGLGQEEAKKLQERVDAVLRRWRGLLLELAARRERFVLACCFCCVRCGFGVYLEYVWDFFDILYGKNFKYNNCSTDLGVFIFGVWNYNFKFVNYITLRIASEEGGAAVAGREGGGGQYEGLVTWVEQASALTEAAINVTDEAALAAHSTMVQVRCHGIVHVLYKYNNCCVDSVLYTFNRFGAV